MIGTLKRATRQDWAVCLIAAGLMIFLVVM